MISLLAWLRRLRFRRIDTRLHHIVVGSEGLRLIDPSNLNKKHDPFPRKVWRGLQKRGHAASFRAYLREDAPEMYLEWERGLAE